MNGNKSDSLSARRALVTGASSGIGRAITLELLNGGATVVANARRADRLEQLKNDAGDSAGRLHTFSGDASDPQTIARMMDFAQGSLGEVDLVVVNAGRGLSGSLLTSDIAQWNDMIQTNVLARCT